MVTVSILIPAFKSTYLKKALDSAVAQTFDDVEILVGDDTPHGDLERITSQYNNPKIKYWHHGFQDGARNCKALWEKSSGQYIKWLYDDDLLMPTSVESLVAALRTYPQAAFAFHERVMIDENDTITHRPPRLLGDGQVSLLDRAFLVQNLIGKSHNFIGEPSNILLNKSLADLSRRQFYKSWKLQFLSDVGSYLNMTENAPLVAVGGYLGAFRRHGNQASDTSSPIFSAGLYEWELLLRGEAASGFLSREILVQAQQFLNNLYRGFVDSLPELQGFIDGLHELSDCPPERLLETETFLTSLTHARGIVATRIAARKIVATPHSHICAICEQHVAQWLPHPRRDQRSEFIKLMATIGSNLERYTCPNCQCNDRDRHLWLYLNHGKLLNNLSHKRILHIAPEAILEPRIRALSPLEYICGDLHPRASQHHKIDVEKLEFPDEYFDLIICNHVLEHVAYPSTAINELKRCLTPAGHLVAQTPYSPRIKQTFEMSSPISAAFATMFYGQDDHVRLFGMDLIDYFHAEGLKGRLIPHAEALADTDPLQWGVNEHEPFFLFSKSEIPAFANLD